MLRSVEGFENAKITRFGYAIEYDYIEPTELKHTLELKRLKIFIVQDRLMELQVMKRLQHKALWRESMQA